MVIKESLHLIHSIATKMHNEFVPYFLLSDTLIHCQRKLGNDLLDLHYVIHMGLFCAFTAFMSFQYIEYGIYIASLVSCIFLCSFMFYFFLLLNCNAYEDGLVCESLGYIFSDSYFLAQLCAAYLLLLTS